jgi:hypothetical protein
MEKRQPLQQMLLGKVDICMQYTKTTSMYMYKLKVDEDLNITPETLKLVQGRVWNTLKLISIGNDFLNRTQMSQ